MNVPSHPAVLSSAGLTFIALADGGWQTAVLPALQTVGCGILSACSEIKPDKEAKSEQALKWDQALVLQSAYQAGTALWTLHEFGFGKLATLFLFSATANLLLGTPKQWRTISSRLKRQTDLKTLKQNVRVLAATFVTDPIVWTTAVLGLADGNFYPSTFGDAGTNAIFVAAAGLSLVQKLRGNHSNTKPFLVLAAGCLYATSLHFMHGAVDATISTSLYTTTCLSLSTLEKFGGPYQAAQALCRRIPYFRKTERPSPTASPPAPPLPLIESHLQ